jgi:hypothetical protein
MLTGTIRMMMCNARTRPLADGDKYCYDDSRETPIAGSNNIHGGGGFATRLVARPPSLET